MVSDAKPIRRWSPRYLLALVIVATIAAGFAIAFRATLSATIHAIAGAASVVDAMTGAAWWWRLGLPMVGAFVAGLLARTIARREGGGVSDVMEAVALGRARLSMVTTLVKSAASWCEMTMAGRETSDQRR